MSDSQPPSPAAEPAIAAAVPIRHPESVQSRIVRVVADACANTQPDLADVLRQAADSHDAMRDVLLDTSKLFQSGHPFRDRIEAVLVHAEFGL